MKKLLAVSALLNVVLLVGLLMKDGTIQAEGGRGAGIPVGNGDVNGDGDIDVSDVLYTLVCLFNGGPEPVPYQDPVLLARVAELEAEVAQALADLGACNESLAACESQPPARLTATGQTGCYDTDGNTIDCASTDWPGQDGRHQAGCPSEGRFTDNGDGTVTDQCTGLMWQQDTADVDGNGSIGEGDGIDWQGALKYCDGLTFAGHSDWRLPNVRELESIVDYGRYVTAMDPIFGAAPVRYWSSSTFFGSTSYAWYVSFYYGVILDGKAAVYNVRAVRNAP